MRAYFPLVLVVGVQLRREIVETVDGPEIGGDVPFDARGGSGTGEIDLRLQRRSGQRGDEPVKALQRCCKSVERNGRLERSWWAPKTWL